MEKKNLEINLLLFWDFIDEKQIATRKEYSKEEQKELLNDFFLKIKEDV